MRIPALPAAAEFPRCRVPAFPSKMKNALEETVSDVFTRLKRDDATFCTCLQCHDDVITRALNKARPRYISGSPVGSAVTRVALSHEQARAEIAVILLEAMRLVRDNPRHTLETPRFVEGGVR